MGKGYMEKHDYQEEERGKIFIMCDYLTMYKDLDVWKHQNKNIILHIVFQWKLMQQNVKENLILSVHIAIAVSDTLRGHNSKVTEQCDS